MEQGKSLAFFSFVPPGMGSWRKFTSFRDGFTLERMVAGVEPSCCRFFLLCFEAGPNLQKTHKKNNEMQLAAPKFPCRHIGCKHVALSKGGRSLHEADFFRHKSCRDNTSCPVHNRKPTEGVLLVEEIHQFKRLETELPKDLPLPPIKKPTTPPQNQPTQIGTFYYC
jgi:hypothetical protein